MILENPIRGDDQLHLGLDNAGFRIGRILWYGDDREVDRVWKLGC